MFLLHMHRENVFVLILFVLKTLKISFLFIVMMKISGVQLHVPEAGQQNRKICCSDLGPADVSFLLRKLQHVLTYIRLLVLNVDWLLCIPSIPFSLDGTKERNFLPYRFGKKTMNYFVIVHCASFISAAYTNMTMNRT